MFPRLENEEFVMNLLGARFKHSSKIILVSKAENKKTSIHRENIQGIR